MKLSSSTKLILRQLAAKNGISLGEIARRTGAFAQSIGLTLNNDRELGLEKLTEIAKVANIKVKLTLSIQRVITEGNLTLTLTQESEACEGDYHTPPLGSTWAISKVEKDGHDVTAFYECESIAGMLLLLSSDQMGRDEEEIEEDLKTFGNLLTSDFRTAVELMKQIIFDNVPLDVIESEYEGEAHCE